MAFAVLGLCPGTATSAVAQGSLDALFGGIVGILIGSWAFANLYPKLQKPILSKVDFGTITLPQVLKVNPWVVVIPVAILLTALLVWLESVGL